MSGSSEAVSNSVSLPLLKLLCQCHLDGRTNPFSHMFAVRWEEASSLHSREHLHTTRRVLGPESYRSAMLYVQRVALSPLSVSTVLLSRVARVSRAAHFHGMTHPSLTGASKTYINPCDTLSASSPCTTRKHTKAFLPFSDSYN
jgi:hypothetical protein